MAGMTPDFESDLLTWIEEQVNSNLSGTAKQVATVKLLSMRMAIEGRSGDENLTKSTEISLKAFERANLYRTIRALERKRFIDFVDAEGKPLAGEALQAVQSSSPSRSEPSFLALTVRGREELARLKRLK
jgi:hypothetical protein